MKTYSILLLTLLISLSSFAQNSINYKALIKDVNSNVIANQTIDVRFTILVDGGAGDYIEIHTKTTDANGIIIANIGEGDTVINGNFNGIDWTSNPNSLKTEIDIEQDGTYEIMEVTSFNFVPYAIQAIRASEADNVTGLEQITEGSNTGWRLKGEDPEYYGPIGGHAIDLSISSEESTTYGATGFGSVAMGINTTASGYNATAIGRHTIASQISSFAMGELSKASGWFSVAMGRNTIAPSYVETAIGSYNTDYIPNNTSGMNDNDRLFVVGNGTGNSNRSNALTVLKNGSITAPSLTTSLINTAGNQALVTKGYADTKYFNSVSFSAGTSQLVLHWENGTSQVSLSSLSNSGLEHISENGNTGWRLKGINPANYANIGVDAVDLSISSSTTNGASGDYSTALGNNTVAFGAYSFAAGKDTFATAQNSTAIGNNTTALGIYSTSMGVHTIANAYASTAIGKFNEVDMNGLFMVGNGTGTSAANRNNAFIIKEDGKIGVNTSNPSSLLEVVHDNIVPTSSNQNNAFSIKNSSNGGSWQFFTSGGGGLLLYKNGSYRGSFNGMSGAYVQTSDRRLKKDILPLANGTLQKVLQLNPVSYLMKEQTGTNLNLGLISQEVQELFPSITHYSKEQDILTLSYTELIPILIKALQEQQDIIDTQNKQIEGLISDNVSLKDTVNNIISRVEKIESNNQ